MYDLLIRGGTVIDGSGDPARTADVAIQGEHIVAVGQVSGNAREVIDASGALVTPGWVDVHTHYDGQATWDPLLAPSSWHGVTTAVMGNCGVGFAPVRPGSEQFLIELMEGVEDIPGSALAEGIDWRWESFAQYLDALDSGQRVMDIGTQVPHGAVRAYVMGERCNERNAVPTPDELRAMQAEIRAGLQAGALGFSTSRTWLHTDRQGVHVPGTFAEADEMLALGLAMKGLRHGVYEIVSDHLGTDEEWSWVREFVRQTGRPVTLVATSAAAYEGNRMYNVAEGARAEGFEVRPQIAGRPTGLLHGLQSSFHVFQRCPTFRAGLESLPLAAKVARMRDAGTRAQILAEAADLGTTMLGTKVADLLWQIFPLGEHPNYEPDREDSVAGIAASTGQDAFAVMYDLLLRDEGRELFYQPLGGYQTYNFDFFRASMEHPNALFGLSDGGAHCGVIADAGMPTFILTHWGRDRTKGARMPLPFLVRKLARDTALAYGLDDRGLLAPGKLADVNVIDFQRLALKRPEAVFDLPAGGRRLVQRVRGYEAIIKRGQCTFRGDEATGALPGRLVRGG
ncbi:MAG: amidohydrolase family protein [Pseudomonadales bacterium]|nr:amidohydrolase family protein [Pseudomonadales bacterium]MCP5184144.1 amidohydrolase family protein [Pseudomonadales bacterium]